MPTTAERQTEAARDPRALAQSRRAVLERLYPALDRRDWDAVLADVSECVWVHVPTNDVVRAADVDGRVAFRARLATQDTHRTQHLVRQVFEDEAFTIAVADLRLTYGEFATTALVTDIFRFSGALVAEWTRIYLHNDGSAA
ncbi:MAG TPA: hypothetical protein VFJ98_03500 [Mycobacteriales bacterium]|nr:hypothetical protein [Mycobacteriales bacterium]